MAPVKSTATRLSMPRCIRADCDAIYLISGLRKPCPLGQGRADRPDSARAPRSCAAEAATPRHQSSSFYHTMYGTYVA